MKVKIVSLIQISLWIFIEYNQIAEQNIKKEIIERRRISTNKQQQKTTTIKCAFFCSIKCRSVSEWWGGGGVR